MKRIKFISNIALVGLMALGATSCEDWLTIYPQNKVVEEQFWEVVDRYVNRDLFRKENGKWVPKFTVGEDYDSEE